MTRIIQLAAAALLAVVLAPSAVPAQEPVPAKPAEQRAWLFEALRTAPTEGIAEAITEQIWLFWFRQAPDAEAHAIMGQAMERRQAQDYAGAITQLDKLVMHAPGWAEAWNQRATILFFQDELDRSLDDVEKVLTLEPNHFGALSGKAVILMRQGRVEQGQRALRRALEVHPWLKERQMLITVPGKDL